MPELRSISYTDNNCFKVKIPMLLSKPKKSYKSVSKTELLKETHDQHQHEEPPAPDNGNIFEEIQSVCDKVKKKQYIEIDFFIFLSCGCKSGKVLQMP